MRLTGSTTSASGRAAARGRTLSLTGTALLVLLGATNSACSESDEGDTSDEGLISGTDAASTNEATTDEATTAPDVAATSSTDDTGGCATPPCAPTSQTDAAEPTGTIEPGDDATDATMEPASGGAGGDGSATPEGTDAEPAGAGGVSAEPAETAGAGGESSSAGGETGAGGANDEMGAGGTPVAGEPAPDTPPEGAYVACSGDPLPALTLTTVIDGLEEPTFAVTPNGDAQTMFVTERSGGLLRFDLSQDPPTSTTILDLGTPRSAECGFLSVALHPNFDGMTENRIYVSYNPTCPAQIAGSGGASALDEYVVDGDSATFSQSLFTVEQPEGNHNGGGLAFGPDGYLYLGLGDGGGSNDGHGDNGNGQDPNTPLGAMLRFDVDAIDIPPAGNLTSDDVGGASVDARVMHYGLRNPWRFSFDQLTGDLYIGDVGQNTWEEVNFAPAGSGPLNFGWAAREGLTACPTCNNKSLLEGTTSVDPIHVHPRATGGSSTGGYVYRGSNIPGLYGRYIYGDYATGDMWVFTYDGEGDICDEVEDPIPSADIPNNSLVSFAQDANGEIYVINMSRATISRIDPG